MRRSCTTCLGSQRLAFTLAELVVVVLILSIMSAVAVPRYTDAVARFQADAAARRIKADLEYLRQVARRKGSTQAVVFNTATNSYTLTGLSSLDVSSRAYTVELDQTPYNAVIASVNCGGDATLSIDGFGKPDSSGTIVVTSGKAQRTVTIESSAGKVAVQ